MRFECAHCNCSLSIEIDWSGRAEIPVQCGKCDGISVLKSKSRALSMAAQVLPPPPSQSAPQLAAQFSTTLASPPPFRGTPVNVPAFLKEKADESIRAFDDNTDAPTTAASPRVYKDGKKWIAIAGAIAILSGSYMIWNATRTLKKTYRFSQTTSSEPAPNAATIAN